MSPLALNHANFTEDIGKRPALYVKSVEKNTTPTSMRGTYPKFSVSFLLNTSYPLYESNDYISGRDIPFVIDFHATAFFRSNVPTGNISDGNSWSVGRSA